MGQQVTKTFNVTSPEETARLAVTMSGLLKPGATLLLSGGVGAGKTHFARALIKKRMQDCGIVEDVPSPTYTLVQTYVCGDVEIWHADLYRISDPSEIDELGLSDAFDDAICLIEWPECLGAHQAKTALNIHFDVGSTAETREIRFHYDPDRWSTLVDALEHGGERRDV